MATLNAPTTPAADGKSSGAVPTPVFELVYGQKDITVDVTPYVLSISFTDKLSGESDEIQVELEDSDGRWRDAWYPGKGDTLLLKLGLEGQKLLNCGTFSIDEIELGGPPDTVSLRGLSASVTAAMRTRSNRGFENTTLLAIASRIAKKHALRLEGTIEPLKLDRVTQYNETDLAFMTRLAREYGYIVKVTHEALVFSHRVTLREAEPVHTLTPAMVGRYRLRDTINRIYKQAKVKYQDTRTKKMVTIGVKADGSIGPVAEETVNAKGKGQKPSSHATSADTLNMQSRARTRDEAVSKVCAGINRHNEYQREATLNLEGNVGLKAGNTLSLTGFGRLSGSWLVTAVRHDIDRQGGYSCELTLGQGPIANPHKKGKNGKAGTSREMVVIGKKADGSIGVVDKKTQSVKGKRR
ncbi:phage late control D family protein [Serratia marcescens]|uniref:phage late control D family protein n=1 Tax=Serratia marcescens TaxID=615 RepID=UPI000928B8F7|nr:contractile injection system protein, VgrG/Pvc8 family [Serratia marcescens]OJH83047.1 phage late control gene D protein [Serratia marcescens]